MSGWRRILRDAELTVVELEPERGENPKRGAATGEV
jgi:hypothetical protein